MTGSMSKMTRKEGRERVSEVVYMHKTTNFCPAFATATATESWSCLYLYADHEDYIFIALPSNGNIVLDTHHVCSLLLLVLQNL